VLRGGSWDSYDRRARAAARFYFNPVSRNNIYGFRVLVCSSPIF
jgi:formylglycine-generating enzyme required for sulfatase activity